MATSDEAGTSVGQVRAWITAGERYDVEFKGEHRGPLNDRELVEAVVCLANGSGGVLLVGVEDDGTPTGARPRHESGRTDVLRLQALIANNTLPPVATSVSIVDLDGVSVIVVEIPDSPRVVGTTRGTYLRRATEGTVGPRACRTTPTRCLLMRLIVAPSITRPCRSTVLPGKISTRWSSSECGVWSPRRAAERTCCSRAYRIERSLPADPRGSFSGSPWAGSGGQ